MGGISSVIVFHIAFFIIVIIIYTDLSRTSVSGTYYHHTCDGPNFQIRRFLAHLSRRHRGSL